MAERQQAPNGKVCESGLKVSLFCCGSRIRRGARSTESTAQAMLVRAYFGTETAHNRSVAAVGCLPRGGHPMASENAQEDDVASQKGVAGSSDPIVHPALGWN